MTERSAKKMFINSSALNLNWIGLPAMGLCHKMNIPGNIIISESVNQSDNIAGSEHYITDLTVTQHLVITFTW